MTGLPPEGSPVKILVQVDDAALARWVLWLVEALERRPSTQVFVRIAGRGGGDDNSALATLLVLERMLLRRNRTGGADPIDRVEFGGKRAEPAGFRLRSEGHAAKAPGGSQRLYQTAQLPLGPGCRDRLR